MAMDHQPQLDLSCVRHMINAAEPVDTASIDRFYAVFESHGLKRCNPILVQKPDKAKSADRVLGNIIRLQFDRTYH